MTTQVQFNAFNFKSSQVRVITDPNQEFWFCGSDVCDILGYTNSRKALQDHCKTKGVTKRYTPTQSGEQEMIFINEPNLYRLIIKSRKPEAEPFEAWVFEEVLPQIRKTGKYSIQQQLALPEPEKTYDTNTTAKEIHELVWLLFSHEQMRSLLEHLYKPLEAIGSRYSGAIYGNYTEYKRHYDKCLPILKRFVEQIKADNPKAWEGLQYRLNAK